MPTAAHPTGFTGPFGGATVNDAERCTDTPCTRALAASDFAGYDAVTVATPPDAPWHAHAFQWLASIHCPTAVLPLAELTVMSNSAIVTR